jgi:ubiquitin-protein ligase
LRAHLIWRRQRKPVQMETIDLTGDEQELVGGKRLGRKKSKEAASVIVVDDDNEEAGGGCTARPAKRNKKARAADAPPVWQGLNGTRRLMAEYKEMQDEIEAGGSRGAPCGPARIRNLTFHQDNMHVWRLDLGDFDDDLTEGRQLNEDLRKLEQQQPGMGKVVIEVKFPHDFPRNPFFLRIVRPRFQMYTGHITAGGSVCIQALTTGPEKGNWQSDFSLSGILALVATNMLDNERLVVRTATGPGGVSGPARVDMRESRSLSMA